MLNYTVKSGCCKCTVGALFSKSFNLVINTAEFWFFLPRNTVFTG